MRRREALGLLVASPVLVTCKSGAEPRGSEISSLAPPDLVRNVEPLGYQWKTLDPFLFCVHHDDRYPPGKGDLGPAVSLAGRNIGSDFVVRDGFRMYHGDVVPGFPRHPHRGFETVTVVRRGLVDHADSLGAAARYGRGDVQWLTAGGGIVHAEMFPLLSSSEDNPLELFQIWLNLPSADKMVAAHFSMLWSPTIPKQTLLDASAKKTELTIVAGKFRSSSGPPPPPKSWASRATSDVAIWTLRMEAGARFTLPRTSAGVNRMLYFFRGKDLRVGERSVTAGHGVELRPDTDAPLQNGSAESDILLLQGRPIGEPIVQRGPFVMNTPAEIQKAWLDYRATQFGGWPWPKDDPVHDREARFAKHADGRLERAG